MELCKQWGLEYNTFLEIKNWFKDQKDLPQNTPDEYFAMIIHSCYSDVKLSKKTVEAYFRVKTSAPQLFSGRSLDAQPIKDALKVGPLAILPKVNEDGYIGILGWLDDHCASNFIMDDILKFMYMVVDVILLENPGCPGILFIHDAIGISFKHMFRISITTLRKYFEYIQDGCPIRVKGIHIFNAAGAAYHILNLAKPFIYKEYSKMICMYTSNDFDSMLKNIKMPPDGMPKEYGGTGPSTEKLLVDTLAVVKKHEDWLKFDETLRISEKK